MSPSWSAPLSTLLALLLLALTVQCLLPLTTAFGSQRGRPSPPCHHPLQSTDAASSSPLDPLGDDLVATTMSPFPSFSPMTSLSSVRHAMVGQVVDAEVPLSRGQLVSGFLPQSSPYADFSYRPSALNVPIDIFSAAGRCQPSQCDVHLLLAQSPSPRPENYTYWADYHLPSPVRITSNSPWSCEALGTPLADCVYHFTLYAWLNQEVNAYSLMVDETPVGLNELASGRLTSATLPAGGVDYLYLKNSGLRGVLTFGLEVLWGDADLYISTTNRQPGPASYQWKSDDLGDDLIFVNDSATTPYFYIGVFNKLSSNSSRYALIGSGYSNDGIPAEDSWYLDWNVPQKDYAMASTYRYYTFYIDGYQDSLSVTLRSLRGNADLLINVGPWSSEGDAWPSLSRHQLNSTTLGVDQVNITRPQSGQYIFIAVYSRGNDSRYEIVVTATGRVIPLSSFGFPESGRLSAGGTDYFAFTVPSPLTEPTLYLSVLTFTVKTSEGNADLFVSDSITRPTRATANWTSELVGDGLDVALLRGDSLTPYGPALHAGTYYVAVHAANEDTVYSMYAVLRQRSIMAVPSALNFGQYAPVSHYEVDVPRGVTWDITASLTSSIYGGWLSVYVSTVVEPNPSVASSYQWSAEGTSLRLLPSMTCAGADPICRFYVAIERVRNSTADSDYAALTLVVTSTQVAPPQLLPGIPQEKPTEAPAGSLVQSTGSAGTVYSFTVPCTRAIVQLHHISYSPYPVFIERTPVMFVNRGPLPPLNALRNVLFGGAETVVVSKQFRTLTFDWRHPLLRGQSMEGTWWVNVYPPFLMGYTQLINITSVDCSPMPSQQAMLTFTPYVATLNATSSSALFSYDTPLAAPAGSTVYFTVTPVGNTSASALSLLARSDGLTPAVGSSQWSGNGNGELQLNGSACVGQPPFGSVCQYSLAVVGSAGAIAGSRSASFLLTASTAGRPMAALDSRVAQSVLSGSLTSTAQRHFTALVSPVRAGEAVPLSVVQAEACVGAFDLLVNWRSRAVPLTASSAEMSLTDVSAPSFLSVPAAAAVNGSALLIGAVVGTSSVPSTAYEVRVLVNMTWADASPSSADVLPKLTLYSSVSVGRIRVRIPLATQPRTVTVGAVRPVGAGGQSLLRYSVYLRDQANTSAGTGMSLRSRCGVQRAMSLVYVGTQLTAATSLVEFAAPSLRSTARYSLVVLCEPVWRQTSAGRTVDEPSTAGYLLYSTLSDVRPGTYIPDEPDDDGGDGSTGQTPLPSASATTLSTAALAAIVVVAVALVAVLTALLLRWRQQKAAASAATVAVLRMDPHTLLPAAAHLPGDTQGTSTEPSTSYARMPY